MTSHIHRSFNSLNTRKKVKPSSKHSSVPNSGAEDNSRHFTGESINQAASICSKLKNTRNLTIDQACFLSSKEAKSTYVVLVISLHWILLSMPLLNTAQAWTLTNVIHAVSMYYLLHHCKGAPFARHDQGKNRRLTYWEQIDGGEQMTDTRRFFIVMSIIMFLIAQFYSMRWHTAVNILALGVSIVPKMSQFHKFRLFGFNKY